MTRLRAPKRRTQRSYTIGGVAAGACFLLAVLLELSGRPTEPGSLTDPVAIATGVLGLTSWGWSSLGVWITMATPAVSLITTITEYHAIHDRRAARMAMAVLAVLALSLAVALLRSHQ